MIRVPFQPQLFMLAAILSIARAAAQVPGGFPLPAPGLKLHEPQGQVRLGYFLATRTFRFQGAFDVTDNLAEVARSPIYFFADVDIESRSDARQNFAPDRFTGTFELGARRIAGVAPLTLFVRHQSPHNIDRTDRRQGSWNMVGIRWDGVCRGTRLTIGGGHYLSQVVNDYQWDLHAQAAYPLGHLLGKEWVITLNAEHVAETNSGFTDFWVEPDVMIAPHLHGFLGVGQIHNIDVFGGKNDVPVIIGLKLLL